MKKILMSAAVFLAGFALGFFMSHGALNAQSAENESGIIISRLDDIARSQQELMEAVTSIKEELQIIKVRVTQLQ